MEPDKPFDAFISHASEDKRYFVRPLAQRLAEYGAIVWYDEFSLKPGVSLSRSIEHGIARSRFGLVVLSDAFFNKPWPEYELHALNAFEVANPGVIIPIWYKVTVEQVRTFSPYLSDKLAIVAGKQSIEDTVVQILEVIRADLFEEINRKRAYYELVQAGEFELVGAHELDRLIPGPIRHKAFPLEIIMRMRLIWTTLIEVFPSSFADWVDGFQRDTHPEDEIQIWEHIAAAYNESILLLQVTDPDKKMDVFAAVFADCNGFEVKNPRLNHLSDLERTVIQKVCLSRFPLKDIAKEKMG